ncbi:MAG: hypothetical protein ACWA5W_07260 [Phycisphaerales bacterium]
MTSSLHRRAFIAASTLSIPTIALASGMPKLNEQMDFHDLMKQIGRNLKSMRKSMRSLETDAQWSDAAFLANQIALLMTQCIEAADQVDIPSQAKDQYAGDKAQFTTDLQLQLAEGVITATELFKELLNKNKLGATDLYGSLRMIRNDGHGAFQEEDDD